MSIENEPETVNENYMDLSELAEELAEFDEMPEECVKNTDERENAIEWYTGKQTVTVCFSDMKYKNKILELAKKRPEDVLIERLPETNGGYLLAKIPRNWLHIVPPRVISEEERRLLSERAQAMRDEGKGIFAPRQKK